MTNCIFCKIASGEIPCHKIYEDSTCLAFLDIAKHYEGHTLLIPKTHTENLMTANAPTLEHMIKVANKITNHYITLGYTGANLLTNAGASAEQSVMHLHFHIVPRKDNDGETLYPEKPQKDLDLEKIANRLKMVN